VTDTSFGERLEAIEAGYEFMLAYAAQGRQSEEGGGGEIRVVLASILDALDGLTDSLSCTTDEEGEFASVVTADAARARAAVALVSAQTRISSQLIDNLNASLHVRTLLTDLFILDETLRTS
jgi:hypothetical protein